MAGADAGQQVDEGPYGGPQGCPGTSLPPLADDLVVVAERGGGFTVPGVQCRQGDFGEPGDQAAACGLGELDRLLQVLLAWPGSVVAVISPKTDKTSASAEGAPDRTAASRPWLARRLASVRWLP